MLTNSAQWGWDFARDSWWPVQEWPASHLRGTAPKTLVRWTNISCLLPPFLSGPLVNV